MLDVASPPSDLPGTSAEIGHCAVSDISDGDDWSLSSCSPALPSPNSAQWRREQPEDECDGEDGNYPP